MITLFQPGQHPDADQLSAFAEHALPPHEQQQTLAHLATCADCRNLVYLAQQATPIDLPQPELIPVRRPWFASWKFALPAAVALACLILLTFHLHHATTTAPTPTASVEPAQVPLPAAPPAVSPSPEPRVAARVIPAPTAIPAGKKQKRLVLGAVSGFASQSVDAVSQSVDASAMVSDNASAASASAFTGRATSSGALSLRTQVTPGGGITGTITDPSGAVIPRAKVTATNTDTGVFITRETAPTGNFSIPSLQAGNYRVEVAAPGFERMLQENVHVEPLQQIALNMKLSVGSASQTVTVTNAAPALDTTNATLGGTIDNELYSELPLAMNGQPQNPSAFQQLKPSVQQQAAAAPPPSPQAGQQGVYGGTGQTNLNQNYIEATPTGNAGGSAKPAAAPAAPAGAAPATLSGSLGVSRMAKRPLTLPSHLATLSTISNAHQTLAIDSAGALFRSTDAGVTWHAVSTQWQGRATRLTLAALTSMNGPLAAESAAGTVTGAPAKATSLQTFELTTDNNITYTSQDGQTWHRK